jgi:aspartyl-tRNA synthetase
MSEKEISDLEARLEPKNGDMIFFSADEFKKAVSILNKVRLALRDKFELADPKALALCWVIDFPMFEQDEVSGKIDFAHNPFSMPI